MNAQRLGRQVRRTQKGCPRLSIDLSVKLDLSEKLQAIRRKAMDADQLFDASKRAPVSSEIIYTSEKQNETLCVSCTGATADTGIVHDEYECYVLPLNPPPTPLYFDQRSRSDIAEDLAECLDIIVVGDAEKRDTAKLADNRKYLKEYIRDTDDFDRDGYTLTRTIIQPADEDAGTPILGIFLQPSLCGLNCDYSC